MFDRLRRALVESFVGAIGLGWIFAQGVLHFSGIFTAPIAGWIVRDEYKQFADHGAAPSGFLLRDAFPELVRAFSLLLIGYVLLRWLYFKSVEVKAVEAAQILEQGA